MSWLKDNGYKNFEEFANDYANNSFTFPQWAEKAQHKYKDKIEGFIGCSSGTYRFALMFPDEKHGKQILEQIKFLWHIWKKGK